MLPLLMIQIMMMMMMMTVVDEAVSTSEVDLNCSENVSDSDEHSDNETIENKAFPHLRVSPVTSSMQLQALRPCPVRFGAGTDVTLVTATPVIRPSASAPVFLPHGDVFKARVAKSHSSSGEPDVSYSVRC